MLSVIVRRTLEFSSNSDVEAKTVLEGTCVRCCLVYRDRGLLFRARVILES